MYPTILTLGPYILCTLVVPGIPEALCCLLWHHPLKRPVAFSVLSGVICRACISILNGAILRGKCCLKMATITRQCHGEVHSLLYQWYQSVWHCIDGDLCHRGKAIEEKPRDPNKMGWVGGWYTVLWCPPQYRLHLHYVHCPLVYRYHCIDNAIGGACMKCTL